MKPGKPTTYATCEYNNRTKYILCLPGNPVSATVTAHLFALPLLKRLNGDLSKPVVVTAKVFKTTGDSVCNGINLSGETLLILCLFIPVDFFVQIGSKA